MITYKVINIRAKYPFTEASIKRCIELANKNEGENIDESLKVLQVLDDCLNSKYLPLYLFNSPIKIIKTEQDFINEDPFLAREAAFSYAENLNEVLHEDVEANYKSLAAIYPSFFYSGIAEVIRELNYKLNLQSITVVLQHENENLIVGNHFETSIETHNREQELLNQYKIQ